MAFEIRPARMADAEALAFVNVTAWRDTYRDVLSAEFLAALSIEERVDSWRRALERARVPAMVTEVDGEVRGYAVAGPPNSEEAPRDLQLYMIYQLASEHGTGSGQALLEAAIGDRPAFLWVAERNPRAIAFYRRNGFEPDGLRDLAEQWENLAEIRMVR